MGETKQTKRVAIVGCGAIGTLIAQAFERKLLICDDLILFDSDIEKAEILKNRTSFPAKVAIDFDDMLDLKPKVVIEAASQQAVRDYAQRVISENIDLIVLSTGALLELNLTSSKIHVPSGAIGGIDALSSANLAGIEEVFLTSRKNPKALSRDKKEPRIVYEGTAEEAARLFPREMNVAATLALSAKPAAFRVRVLSDPAVQRNTHEIQVKWLFGEMFLRFANDPHPDNPHTSALAAWSAIKLLQSILQAQEI